MFVSSGIYYENIIWPEENGIKLIGSNTDSCIIDGKSISSVISFEYDDSNFIDSSTQINGFTIQNGNSKDDFGGGLRIIHASPSLINLRIINNIAKWGGGIYFSSADPILHNIIIMYNIAESRGGGIFCEVFNELNYVSNILIADNYSYGHGGGIFLSAVSKINFEKATIAGNIVGTGDTFGAGIYADGGTAILENSIIFYNRRDGNYGINYNLNGYTMEILNEFFVSYSNVEGDENWVPNGNGNISINPEFIDHENNNYKLQENSPCIDTGNPNSDYDLDGTPADMGNYYFEQLTACDSGYVDLDGYCFYELDIAVLQSFINNSIDSNWDDYNNCEEGDFFCGSPNPYMDYNTELVIDGEYINSYSYLNNGTVDPLELGYQTWADGRLVSLLCGAYIYCGLSGEIPENINNLTEIEVLRLEVNYFDGEVPDSICELENINFNDYLSFDLSYNYLCPPYPYCVPDNAVQYMDTFDCLENGDFNNDGSLDILDIIILVNNIINLENIDIDGADINNDQEVNILDVILLVSIVLDT